jgi:4-aminobutyrate aminotransferase/(S)-3-amino-2-methylpropionate transaminase
MPSFVENAVRTEIPGPVSKASSKDLDTIFDARAVHFVVDYDKSHDN